MKKYKLIQEYDGSPKLGTIIVETMIIGSRPKFRTFTISGHDKNCNMGNFRIDNPEISPEYWKEITEYPIGTKAKDNRINKIFTKKADGWYNSNKTAHTDESISGAKWINIVKDEIIDKDYEILSGTDGYGDIYLLKELTEKQLTFFIKNLGVENDILIHSVKRLSDNTIFTIGDFVKQKKNKHNTFTITGFKLDCNNEHMLALGGNNAIRIDKLNLSKKVLFTTNDGVDIRENDRFYGVELGVYRFINDIAHKNVTYTNTSNLYFSTKEAAEEYVNLRKPYLSNKDVLDEVIKCNSIKEIIKIFTNKVAH